jgi:tetratricopeptide (TPR) repeat protein
MDPKDIFTITLSATAICVSVASFVITWRQRKIEDQRSIRKSLADSISELTEVQLARLKLDKDNPGDTSESVVTFRRTYNMQRRFLANHCDFLASQIPHLVTDVDCLVIAGAFETSQDFERADYYYQLSIEKAPNASLKLLSLRSAAIYWFNRGNHARGRKSFEDALQLDVPDSDTARQLISDTYMLWAKAERSAGFLEQALRIRELARAAATRIASQHMREDMLNQIARALPISPAPPAA